MVPIAVVSTTLCVYVFISAGQILSSQETLNFLHWCSCGVQILPPMRLADDLDVTAHDTATALENDFFLLCIAFQNSPRFLLRVSGFPSVPFSLIWSFPGGTPSFDAFARRSGRR